MMLYHDRRMDSAPSTLLIWYNLCLPALRPHIATLGGFYINKKSNSKLIARLSYPNYKDSKWLSAPPIGTKLTKL